MACYHGRSGGGELCKWLESRKDGLQCAVSENMKLHFAYLEKGAEGGRVGSESPRSES